MRATKHKKTLEKFLEKLMRATKEKKLIYLKNINEGDEKNKQKKHSSKNVFYLMK